jgi:hexosaminidase
LLEKQPNGKYVIKNRPVLIDDQPDNRWRGLMIDTSRHFLPVSQIKKMIDGVMYNKMNVLHWHIIDQDSFPMEVPTRPELAKYGSLAGTYSPSDLLDIQKYANLRAIRVIP